MIIDSAELEKAYNKKIETLNETIWEHKVNKPQIKEWLENFPDDDEKIQALYLLSRMMYFSESNLKCLLKALYRDLYSYPIIKKIREDNHDTLDEKFIEAKFKEELESTIFFGIGDASESGNFLLYYFRQENRLPLHLFKTIDKVLKFDEKGIPTLVPAYSYVKHFVFIDDVCGSGSQATNDESHMKRNVVHLKNLVKDATISYYMLFGLTKGLKIVKDSKLYNQSGAVITLDDSYRCFSDDSRYFRKCPHNKSDVESMSRRRGYPLTEHIAKQKGLPQYKTDPRIPTIHEYAYSHALGFGNCQLLLSLAHNTPDNTLPIMWFDESEDLWKPIFKRYNKKY